MPDGILPNPTFIDRLVGALVACIGGDSYTLCCVIDTCMDGVHPEGEEIAWRKLRSEPTTAKFLAKRAGVGAEGPQTVI